MKLCFVTKGGEALEGLCFGQVRLHALAIEDGSVEGDLWLLDATFAAVECLCGKLFPSIVRDVCHVPRCFCHTHICDHVFQLFQGGYL